MRAALPALLLIVASGAWASPPVTLDGVTVHLFFDKSGQFSEDVASIEGFASRNFTPISPISFADGLPEGERFNAFLIKLAFSSPVEAYEPGLVASVQLMNGKKRVIMKRKVHAPYIAQGTKTHVGIFVEGHVCEPLILEVRFQAQVVRKQLTFTCGE